MSILQSVPRSRELIQICLPSHANACGVTAGEASRRLSMIDTSFTSSFLILTFYFETRSPPTLARCYPRSFTFYFAIPIRLILLSNF